MQQLFSDESILDHENEDFEGFQLAIPHFGQFALDAGLKTASEQSDRLVHVEGEVQQRESHLDGKPHCAVYSMFFCTLL